MPFPELCRTVAIEAVRRGAQVNFHELWAVLELVDDLQPRLVIDVCSGEALLWAWWTLGARVAAVAAPGPRQEEAFAGGRLPNTVVVLTGDPRDRSTVRRVTDQCAGRQADVLVLGDVHDEDVTRLLYDAYAPLVRDGGVVLVHEVWKSQGVRKFFKALGPAGCRELVGSSDPIGYGVVEIHGKDRASHG